MSEPTKTNRERQREQTRRRLYESALAIFRRDGVHGCRTEDIAKAAGVSRASFYFHFPTKEHVLLARMAETEQEICAAIEALGEQAPIDAVLATLNATMAGIWERDPELLPDLAGAALRFTATIMDDQEATPLRALLSERFALAAERKQIEAMLPPKLLGDFYLANTLGGLLAWYGNQVMPLKSVLDAATHMFWNGVRAPS
ncbi:putative TetR-family transcriptional regulator [Plesiocystis pacifica SIR-1]|uniref:Putative TetR-family transcriptional regulator n=1 Tax=Plesiocystis pacifica SIR-1 TaxID=391625 RepID=A6FY19_9BACT|nr:TetR/AcrR family transcriptional regulator [Plesiocystis pacifica]EDM81398.1 putative TetR-family transcriptional regulator [Plesiocystis pacifica SIR-1]